MQEWGENYWETYSLMVSMLTVQLVVALWNIHNLESKSINFIVNFSQADLDIDILMKLPIGFVIDEVAHGSQIE